MRYKLIQNADRIFSLECENAYDLAMCFLRVQEFYESPNKNFKGWSFSMFEYMDWYAKTQSKQGCFTYPSDWAGFNVSSEQIQKCFSELLKEHWTPYDVFMWNIDLYITKNVVNYEKYYLIGYTKTLESNGDISVFKHEIAHALYFLMPSYKRKMNGLINENEALKKEVGTALKNMGYDKSVVADEIQAYFSTGILEDFKKFQNKESKFKRVFVEEFQKSIFENSKILIHENKELF